MLLSPSDQIVTHDLPPLALRAAFNPRSVNLEKRTIEVVFSTGAKVLRNTWDGKVYEALSLDPKAVRLDRFNSGAPIVDGHPEEYGDYSASSVRGTVVPGSAKTDGKRGVAIVRFAKAEDDPEADLLFRKATDGIVRNASVAYRVYTYQKTTDSESKIPTLVAVDWEPFSLGLVSSGADAGAGFRAHSALETNPCRIITSVSPDALADADRSRRLRIARARF